LGGYLTREAIIERVKGIAQPILDSLGLELVDVFYSGGGRKGLLRVFIDKSGGVTLEDCEKVSQYLGHALDVEDPIPMSYTLEVSSPGLDRPLKRREDFQRSVGKLVRIRTHEPIDGNHSFIGRLTAAGESGIELILEHGKVLRIPFEGIAAARLEIEF
jgi:ribosome maturation factor RimP